MTADQKSLPELRREIDAVDAAIHDLLMRRVAIVDRVRDAKAASGETAWRPAREAEILRRLVARHEGPLPVQAVVRIWRELISALVALQGPFSVAVYQGDGEDGRDYWDLARDHFGSVVALSRHRTARGVIHALASRPEMVGVLPMPQDGEAEPWWPILAGKVGAPLRIAARLPFVAPDGGRPRAEALVVGALAQEPSGDDHSFLLVEASEALSRASLAVRLREAGLNPVFLAGHAETPAAPLFFMEVPEFVGPDDPRLLRAAPEGGPIAAVWAVGGYARPVSAREAGASS